MEASDAEIEDEIIPPSKVDISAFLGRDEFEHLYFTIVLYIGTKEYLLTILCKQRYCLNLW